MVKDLQRKRENRRSNRYWSMMIVGEQGQVISMQRIKPVLIIAAVCLVVAILVTGASVYLYLGAKDKVDRLEKQVGDLELNMEALKEEKDLLMAKLVIVRQQNRRLLKKGNIQAGSQKQAKEASESDRPATGGSKGRSAGPQKAKAGEQQQIVAVDIQRFQVTYDPVGNMLKAVFRLINISRPKSSISGRSVVVFKATGSPPIKWLPSPRVKLIDGVPNGKRGRLFRINNFKTMTFGVNAVTLPIPYDTAAVYVFDRKGKLLEYQEFEFSLPREAVLPAASPKSRSAARVNQEQGKKVEKRNLKQGPINQAAKDSGAQAKNEAGVENGSAVKTQSGRGPQSKTGSLPKTGGVKQKGPEPEQSAEQGAGENNFHLFLGPGWKTEKDQGAAGDSEPVESAGKSPARQGIGLPPTDKEAGSSQ